MLGVVLPMPRSGSSGAPPGIKVASSDEIETRGTSWLRVAAAGPLGPGSLAPAEDLVDGALLPLPAVFLAAPLAPAADDVSGPSAASSRWDGGRDRGTTIVAVTH